MSAFYFKYLEVFLTALKLGLTSFGGPVAHLSFFHDEYVKKKKWISDHSYADLVALCQFLPGPASSQVGMAIGLSRAGIPGAFLSWLGFTLPSAIILVLFGLGISHMEASLYQGFTHGLKIVAVSVVAQAVLAMGKKLCPDVERISIALITCVVVFYFNSTFAQVITLIISSIIGIIFFKSTSELPHTPLFSVSRRSGLIFITLFFTLLIILPLLPTIFNNGAISLFDIFYRTGAMVFGGGHVVLPLLQAEVVPTGLVNNDLFMSGYGMANAIPGPLFAFSAYLGAISTTTPSGWTGALLCLIAAFLPSFLLINGVIPFWEKIRRISKVRQAMLGLNAAVVGILLSALYHPVWTSAIFSLKDFLIAAFAFILIEFLKVASWIVVLITAVVSFFIY